MDRTLEHLSLMAQTKPHADVVLAVMTAHRITQDELAAAVGAAQSTVSRMLSGEYRLIADVIVYLWRRTGDGRLGELLFGREAVVLRLETPEPEPKPDEAVSRMALTLAELAVDTQYYQHSAESSRADAARELERAIDRALESLMAARRGLREPRHPRRAESAVREAFAHQSVSRSPYNHNAHRGPARKLEVTA